MAEIADATPVRDWEEYLALEERTGVRHELVEGIAYAMVGGTQAHNLIAMNLSGPLNAVRGSCRVFQQGMKLRIRAFTGDNGVYPDVMLCCDPSDDNALFVERPSFIAEIHSPSSERTDQGEKLLRYQAIPTLKEYLVAHSTRAEAHIFRASNGWRKQPVDLDAGHQLETADLRVDYDLLYDGVFS
ncbi:MAG: Uma2 family endonuclease [Pseudomonadota bacterium]